MSNAVFGPQGVMQNKTTWALLVLCILAAPVLGLATVSLGLAVPVSMLLVPVIVISALVHLDWIVALYLALAPLYFLLKLWLPTSVGSVWRDVSIALILLGWLLSTLIRRPKPDMRRDWTTLLVISFATLALLQILNSDSLLTGVLGFRTLFRCLPLYFVSLFLLQGEQRERTMSVFFNAFLFGALINVFACALQFLTISVLKIVPPNVWFDPIRGSTGSAAMRAGMYRAVGFFSDPNDVGQIMVVALAIMLPRTMQGSKRHRQTWKILCVITIFAIIGTLAIFAILPALLVMLLFFSLMSNNRTIRSFLVVGSIGCLLIISVGMLTPDNPLSRLGYGYTGELVLSSFSYIPRAFEEGNIVGQGYGVYSDLAERFGVSLGSTTDRRYYWFYLDQITAQIGLLGVAVWICLWVAFLYNGYQNLSQISRRSSIEFQLSWGTWLALVGLFLSSLHYGPYRVGGVDLLLYVLWAFVSTAQPVRRIVVFPRRGQTGESIGCYSNI